MAPISPSPNVALGGLRGGRLASQWTSRLHQSEADLSLAQRGSQNDRALSLVVEFCWFVVTGDGVLLNFLWGFVGLWWLVVGLLLILWWVTMALSVGVLSVVVVEVKVEVGVVAGDCRWPAVIVGGCS
ncbi:hypothetical protein FCV25MIE_04765 [Fagus crenata]